MPKKTERKRGRNTKESINNAKTIKKRNMARTNITINDQAEARKPEMRPTRPFWEREKIAVSNRL